MAEAARIAVDTVRATPTRVMDVRFVLFTPDAYAAFEQALNAAGPADQNDSARQNSKGKDT
jgi:hypothetical protein